MSRLLLTLSKGTPFTADKLFINVINDRIAQKYAYDGIHDNLSEDKMPKPEAKSWRGK
jgi:hypothetical protein